MKTIALLVLLFPAAAIDAPRSQVAVKAQSTYETQLKWNDGEHEQAVREVETKHAAALLNAQKDYEKQLKAALDVALKNKDLEEANRINAVMKELGAPAAAPPATTPDAGGETKPAANEVPDGIYLTSVCRHGDPGFYQLEWMVRGGRAREIKFISQDGKVTPKDHGWIDMKYEDGSFRVHHEGWGYDLWTPIAGGKGFLYQRHEERIKEDSSGIARLVRKAEN